MSYQHKSGSKTRKEKIKEKRNHKKQTFDNFWVKTTCTKPSCSTSTINLPFLNITLKITQRKKTIFLQLKVQATVSVNINEGGETQDEKNADKGNG